MQAINHVATALILKKKFPTAPLVGLIVAVEAVEYLWVALNLLGIERTIIDADMTSVADIHLVHMPFSHSIASSVVIAALVGGVLRWRGGTWGGPVAIAMAIGVMSHILLDLVVHARDIEIGPFMDLGKYGTGLYAAVPLAALTLEAAWGVLCWWIYRGSWMLLGLILLANASSIPFYSATLNTGEGALAGQSSAFAAMILVQMIVTSVLVWFLARDAKQQEAL